MTSVRSTKELDEAIASELKANKPELAIATLLELKKLEEELDEANDNKPECG